MNYYLIVDNKLLCVSEYRTVVQNEKNQYGDGVILDEKAYQNWAAIYSPLPVIITPEEVAAKSTEEPQE
jgi:hypothetical protein